MSFSFLSRALISTAACALSLCLNAQIVWNTALNPPEEALPLNRMSVIGSDAGSLVMSSYVQASGSARLRIAKLSSTGVQGWVRWVDGVPLPYGQSLFNHLDGSITQVVIHNTFVCAANFSSTGETRASYCAEGLSNSEVSVVQALDGDLIFTSGYGNRSVAKYRADGIRQWSATMQTQAGGGILGSGLDVQGNYYAVIPGRFVTLRATDGVSLTNAAIPEVANLYFNTDHSQRVVSRANGDIVVILSETFVSNATVARIARFGADGVKRWQRDAVFYVANGGHGTVKLFAQGSDDVIVAREGQSSLSGSELVQLGASGAIQWQRHLSEVSFILADGAALKAIRTDVSASSSDSLIFPIGSADGALGSPLIYSRADAFATNSWFATANGMVAAFQGDGGIPNHFQYPVSLASSLVFLPPAASGRWIYEAKFRRDAQIADARCLMPKLTQSSPSSPWWAQSAHHEPNNYPTWLARWFGRSATNGTPLGQTPAEASGCGFPVTADGGQIVVNFGNSPRIKKLDNAGTTQWQTEGTLFPTSFPSAPIVVQATNASGETVYAYGNLVGRVNATGATLTEALTASNNPRFIATDASGNALVVYGTDAPTISKVSAAGNVLWTTGIDVPSCSDELVATRKLSNDDLLVGTQSCGEGRLYRINGNGAIMWQRIVAGDFVRPYVRIRALSEDAQGSVFAGGCAGTQQEVQDKMATSLVTSWSSSGVERWSQQADLAGADADCVTSIATDSAGNAVAIVSNASPGGAPLLWSLNATGGEQWRHSGLLANPGANEAEAAMDNAGDLIVLGQSLRNEFDGQLVTLRKISLAAVASSLRVKFLEAPNSPIGFRVPFSVRIGLRNGSDQPSIAVTNQRVFIGLSTGGGSLEGTLECVVAAGESECIASAVLYNKIESGVSLTAWADGMPGAVSPVLSFVAAPTTTTLSIEPADPITAYDIRTVRTSTTSPMIPLGNSQGYINGPYASLYGALNNCTNISSSAGKIAERTCDGLLRTAAFPLSATYQANSNEIASSQATLTAPSIAKSQSQLSIVEDATNTGVGGDRVRFRVKLQTANNFNVVRFIPPHLIDMSQGYCMSAVTNNSAAFDRPNDYYLCETTGLGAGSHQVSFSFGGDDDLLPAQSVTRSVILNAGAVIRGASLPSSVSVCTTTPGVTCSRTGEFNGTWQCVGPAGMSGQLFFVPPAGVSYVFPDSPVSYNNINGVVQRSEYFNWHNEYYSCKLDVDGDGARLAATDGVIILRRMLQISGDALVAGATHSCVPLTPAGIATRINVSAYDLDGNSQVDPATDGLMLMRIMLGFRGEMVLTGALGANPTRTTWNEVLDFLGYSCSFYPQ